MLTGSNKGRLEQEIAALINFISDGRKFFFQKTDFSINSPDKFLNHFVSKELFQTHSELTQLELNIQLLYIKLSSYYQLLEDKKADGVRKQRSAFAHELTDLIFNKRIKYNFFLHKVTENFKKVQFVFYAEGAEMNEWLPLVKSLDLDIFTDINEFLAIWSASEASKAVPKT